MDLKIFLVSLAIIIILDFIWIGLIMNKFYTKELSKIAKKKGERLKPNLMPAFLVYILLALAISLFVMPLTQNNVQALIFGGLIGLIIYGVYDLTNLSVLKDYSKKLTIIDMLWGTFLLGIVSFLTKIIFIKI